MNTVIGRRARAMTSGATRVIGVPARAMGERLRPVARAVHPPVSRAAALAGSVLGVVSRLGWLVIAAGGVSWIVGSALGWQELTVLATVCAALVLIAIVFVIGRSDYAVSLDLASERVVVGERAFGRIDVGNPGSRTLLPSLIELPVGSSFATFHLPRLAPGAEHDELFTIPTQHRAVLDVGPVRSVRGDALGLMRRMKVWTSVEELYVHPATVLLDNSTSGFLKDLEGLPTRDLSSNDMSFHALREYSPGDDRRNVHWKSSAKTGTLMVRQFEETRRSHIAVGLSTSARDYLTEDAFEIAVSVAASVGLQAFREEKELSVVTSVGRLESPTGRRMLDRFSGVQTDDRRRRAVELGTLVGQEAPQSSLVVLVVGETPTATELRGASLRLPLGARVIAVRCVPGAALERRSIGDLPVLTIGGLADLPLGLRRVSAP